MNRYVIRFGSYSLYFNGLTNSTMEFHFSELGCISYGTTAGALSMARMLNGMHDTTAFVVVTVPM